jgi:cytochrome P450
MHRCVGSNIARALFDVVVRRVLDRMSDFTVNPARYP